MRAETEKGDPETRTVSQYHKSKVPNAAKERARGAEREQRKHAMIMSDDREGPRATKGLR